MMMREPNKENERKEIDRKRKVNESVEKKIKGMKSRRKIDDEEEKERGKKKS